MYKLLLCWRYLCTRWIALTSIICVMLGVLTMIVVNSVMAGFTNEMQSRIHNILSDIVIESHGLEGFYDPDEHMQRIEKVAGKYIEGMTPTVVVPAMLSYRVMGRWVPRQVNLIGIDEKRHLHVSDCSSYLQHPENRKELSWDLRNNGYSVGDIKDGVAQRPQLDGAGWQYRRNRAEHDRMMRSGFNEKPFDKDSPFASGTRDEQTADQPASEQPPGASESESADADAKHGQDPFAARRDDPFGGSSDSKEGGGADAGREFDPAVEQHTGAILGIALASYRSADGRDSFFVLPGDDVQLLVPTAGMPPVMASANFTVVDFYESKMNEYDSGFVLVPLRALQQMRGMIDPTTGIGSATAIQIKLKPGVDGAMVRDLLRNTFSDHAYSISTWRDKQGALLAAVDMETAILNVLLFLIIAVAGFGILAIFYMIVVEKTRNVGILKSLGASNRGIMGIFLSYGMLLGLVGSGAGMVLGLLLVRYIDKAAEILGKITGRQVFDPAIYYFQSIPTIVNPFTIAWIVGGAMLIAVGASILPALRAARLHPVEALRYE